MSLTRLPNTVTTSDYQIDNDRRISGNEWIDLLAPAAELAKQIAGTDFVPAEMRGKPAAIVACLLYGAEIGIGPMMALSKVDIVKGRPAPRAELARALALAAGHEIWVEESTNTRVKVSGRRRNSDQIQSVTWTLDDVRKAGISSPMYAKYPRQMLLARASAELVRQMAPDVLGGITMFAEEAADAEPIDHTPVVATNGEPAKATTTRRRPPPNPQPAQAAITAAPTEPELPPLPDEEPAAAVDPHKPGPTEAQNKKMLASFNELGITDRDDRLTFTRTVINRPIVSSKQLTITEAGQVIDALEQIAAGTLEYTMNHDGSFALNPIDEELTLLDD